VDVLKSGAVALPTFVRGVRFAEAVIFIRWREHAARSVA
jgi:hypothetical protein